MEEFLGDTGVLNCLSDIVAKLKPSPIDARVWNSDFAVDFDSLLLTHDQENCFYMGNGVDAWPHEWDGEGCKEEPCDIGEGKMEADAYIGWKAARTSDPYKFIFEVPGSGIIESMGNRLMTQCARRAAQDRALKAKSDVFERVKAVLAYVLNDIMMLLENAGDTIEAIPIVGGAVSAPLDIFANICSYLMENIQMLLDAEQFRFGEAQTHPTELSSRSEQRANANTKRLGTVTALCIQDVDIALRRSVLPVHEPFTPSPRIGNTCAIALSSILALM